MNIKDFAEKFIKAEKNAFQEGNFDALEQLESPNIVIHRIPPLAEFNGFEAHKQYIMSARESVSDIQQEWEYITGDGNVCVLGYKSSGKYKVEVPAMSIPAGATVSNDAMFALCLENDRVAEIWIKGSMTVQ